MPEWAKTEAPKGPRERNMSLYPGFSKWDQRPQMGSQAVSDGVARIDWGRAVKMQLKQIVIQASKFIFCGL